jgi:hypothetical protein
MRLLRALMGVAPSRLKRQLAGHLRSTGLAGRTIVAAARSRSRQAALG